MPGSPAAAAEFRALLESERHAIDVLCGHLHYPLAGLLRQPCRVLTMLREPVDRFVSLYSYILSTPEHRLHERARERTLEEFVGHRGAPEGDNDQVRRLCSVGDATGPVGSVTREMLESAKLGLADSRTVFGLAERFDDSMRMIRRELSWPNVPYARVNVTPNRPCVLELTLAAIERVRDANHLDIELYEFAVELFGRRLRDATGTRQ
jgi:hypothetical protein